MTAFFCTSALPEFHDSSKHVANSGAARGTRLRARLFYVAPKRSVMNIIYTTETENIRFDVDSDGSISYCDNCLNAFMTFDPGFVTIKIESAPIPDLSEFTPFERYGRSGYCKRKENQNFSHYEEIHIIGQHEQKIILTITVADYRTKTSRAKTLQELLSYMPIVKVLASIQIMSR